MSAADEWETVIGLEVHVELATETKMFCTAPNRFGDEPNTCIDPVVLGLPGTLPVLNAQADRAGDPHRAGPGLHGPAVRVRPEELLLSRHAEGLSRSASTTCRSTWTVTSNWPTARSSGSSGPTSRRTPGKSTHIGGGGRIHDADYSLVDYNRAGVPLLEIVSRPDIRSAEQARAYVEELQAILVAIGASDGKMEEGSMRVDANVSVRPAGSDELRTRCEIKNVNSLRSLGRAIDHEARRHVDLWSPVRRRVRRPGTGTRRPVAPPPGAPRKRPRTTATSPSPTWCRSSPTRPGSRRSGPRCPCCLRHVAARLVDELGAAPGDAALLVQRGSGRPGGRGRRRGRRPIGC